ncbi:hypothetical protein K435DRAFT_785283 [Dendrothele bispora CBS 962.96]|uniref:Uncharacterized protein n=1 Tax=Dendrothele bispora (strain CBS 962.96) TaxID=1314807 RepID=A0A4S8KXV4_DENBC|nr:hypothetical protein K435DRAFT_785283 [Dendrothele bispora CBS 962.96]
MSSSPEYTWDMLPQIIKDATRGIKVDLTACKKEPVNSIPYDMDFDSAGLTQFNLMNKEGSPTYLRSAAANLSLFANGDTKDDEPSEPAVQGLWVPNKIKEAYFAGDYATINAAQKQNDADLAPILNALRDYKDEDENAPSPWVEIIDESTKTPYQIIGSDNAWFWVRTLKSESTESNSNETKAPGSDQPTVEIGSYTSNSNFLGISVQQLNNKFVGAAVGVISFMVARSVGSVIKNRLTGVFIRRNLVNAIERNIANGVARRQAMKMGYQIELSLWQKCVTGITSFLAETIISFVIFWLLEKLIDVIYRYYAISVTIRNWDSARSWKIVEWYSDQAKVGEEAEWKPYDLPAAGKKFKLPTGFAPTTGSSLSKHVVYNFENTVKVLAGLGVGFKVVAADDSSKGFMFKYLCPRGPDNTMGLRGNLGDGNLKNFYDGSWAGKGTMKLTDTVTDLNVPITMTTNALGGEESHVYKVDVQIGS